MSYIGDNWKSIEDIQEMTPNQLVSWFLISSYCYYEIHRPIMSDQSFDCLVQRLKEHWDEATHPHKGLITESHLEARRAPRGRMRRFDVFVFYKNRASPLSGMA